MTPLADLLVRSSLLLLAGLALDALLRRRSAALRHRVLAGVLLAAAAVPPLAAVLPAWTVTTPPAWSGARDVATVATATAFATDAAIAPAPAGGPSILALIWIAGTAAGALLLLAGLARLAWVSARARPVTDEALLAAADCARRASGIRRRVALLQTDSPHLLATWGLFRPCVLLPAHAREWTARRAHVVFHHEMAHITRHDWMVQLAADVFRLACWFSPLLWIACRRLRARSEQACDDAVLRAGVPADEYAAHLVELARRGRAGRLEAAAVPMARISTLEGRIAAMLNDTLDHGPLSRRAAAAIPVLLVALLLPLAALRAAQEGPRPLEGSVYDPTGAVLPGVELTLHGERQIELQATSDASGAFAFAAVEPGQYVLEAKVPGFRSLRQELELKTARDWNRAITLQVGDVRETISVQVPRLPPQAPREGARAPVPIKVGGNIRPPRKIKDVKPIYPTSMREAGREGVVPVEAIIDRDGSPKSVRVLTAQVHPDFAIAAADAVRQWRFDPTLLNGQPVEVVMQVSVTFSLSD